MIQQLKYRVYYGEFVDQSLDVWAFNIREALRIEEQINKDNHNRQLIIKVELLKHGKREAEEATP